MQPITFPEVNHVMTKEGCFDLPVCGTRYADGRPVLISYWKPSKEDLDSLNNGGGIYLFVEGVGLPPLNLDTISPFTVQPR